jgi:catechol 2,3-dioxygenase-like lactoylglutathione lyase family enzyme
MSRRTGLFQQAYLVNDLAAACAGWSDLLGAGPFVLAPHHRTERFSYRGTDTEADVSYAFGYLGDQMIQFIQQHDDAPSIYRDMYPEGAEGFHHIGILVDDFEAAIEQYNSKGFETACRLYADGVDAAYVDTRAVTGGFTEIHGNPPHILKAFDRWQRANDARKPGDDPILSS